METKETLNTWGQLDAFELIATVLKRYGRRAIIGTSFQKTGIVSIDIASKKIENFRVYTIDTKRLFQETYAYMEALKERYSLDLEIYEPETKRTLKMVQQHGEHLFFKSKEMQELCCHVRKVLPNNEVLRTADVWITGLRKDQSPQRSQLKKIQLLPFEERTIIKVAPLFDWTEEQIDEYLQVRNLPVHPLYQKRLEAGQMYKSIGCHTCTVPVLPQEHPRDGRWPWQNSDSDKECGLQLLSGSGI